LPCLIPFLDRGRSSFFIAPFIQIRKKTPAQITRSVGAWPRHPLSRRGASLVLVFYLLGFFTLPFLLCFSPAQSNPGRAFCKAFPAGQKNLFAQASPLFCSATELKISKLGKML
jgi:hypothetical protein